MLNTKNVPQAKLVKGEEVVQPPEMTFKGPKCLLKVGRQDFRGSQRKTKSAQPASVPRHPLCSQTTYFYVYLTKNIEGTRKNSKFPAYWSLSGHRHSKMMLCD